MESLWNSVFEIQLGKMGTEKARESEKHHEQDRVDVELILKTKSGDNELSVEMTY